MSELPLARATAAAPATSDSYARLYALVIAALVADIALLAWLTGYGR